MGANRSAAEAVVAALRGLGRLEPVDGARVEAFLSLAEAVDAAPTNAGLWKQYREAEQTLRESDVDDDPLADLFAQIRDAEDA